LVDRGAAHGYHDLTRDVFQRMIRDAGMQVSGYEYKDICFRMDSVQSYFKFNLDTLDTSVRHRLFPDDRPVYTKVRDEMPARYMDNARVVNSMVADGCVVDGTVEHSVLFRGVKIDKGASVKNCIIMQDSHIEEGVQLENCILDKQAQIKHDGRLIGPSAYPIVISKNMVI
ncbi:MAG: glucose-1-phosphate adenylyltransferase subunit GlgD, partial [Clostridia bacterium]